MCKRSDALSLAVLIGRGLDFAFLFFYLLSLFVQFSGCVLNMITFHESLKSGSFFICKNNVVEIAVIADNVTDTMGWRLFRYLRDWIQFEWMLCDLPFMHYALSVRR